MSRQDRNCNDELLYVNALSFIRSSHHVMFVSVLIFKEKMHRNTRRALASAAQLVECHPLCQKVAG